MTHGSLWLIVAVLGSAAGVSADAADFGVYDRTPPKVRGRAAARFFGPAAGGLVPRPAAAAKEASADTGTPNADPSIGDLTRLAGALRHAIDATSVCAAGRDPSSESCATSLGWLTAADARGAGGTAVEQALFEQRRRVSHLKKWTREYQARCESSGSRDSCEGSVEKLRTEVDAARDALDRGLQDAGVRESLTAEIVSGFLLERAQGEPSASPQADAPAYLLVRSRPFGFRYDQDRDWDFQFTARFGLVPTLWLVEPKVASSDEPGATPPTEATPEPASAATDTLSTVVDGRLDFTWHPRPSLELSGSAAVGQIWAKSETVIRQVDGQDTLYAKIGSDDGLDRAFFEGGLRLRFYDDLPRGPRAEQPSVEPRGDVSVMYRYDPRLSVTTAGPAFSHPEDRLVLRLMLSGIPVVDRRDPKANTVQIGLGIEHERGLTGNGAPAATRVFIRGDVGILKALTGAK